MGSDERQAVGCSRCGEPHWEVTASQTAVRHVAVVLKLKPPSESPGWLVKTKMAAPTPSF